MVNEDAEDDVRLAKAIVEWVSDPSNHGSIYFNSSARRERVWKILHERYQQAWNQSSVALRLSH